MPVSHSCVLEFSVDDGDYGPCQLVPSCLHVLRLYFSRDGLGPESLLVQANDERTEESPAVKRMDGSQSEGNCGARRF